MKNAYTTGQEITNDWKNCTSNYKNIQYKSENDWRMVYLARTEGSNKAFIEWSFDMSKFNKPIKQIKLKSKSKCFENGSIKWFMSFDEKMSKSLKYSFTLNTKNESNPFKINGSDGDWLLSDFVNANLCAFKIKAELTGDVGKNSWQHTQLFRQSLDDNENLFNISFHF